MIRKEFAGSVFEIPADLEEEFNTRSNKIMMGGPKLSVARQWVSFYMIFEPYYKGEIQSIH